MLKQMLAKPAGAAAPEGIHRVDRIVLLPNAACGSGIAPRICVVVANEAIGMIVLPCGFASRFG